MMLEHLTDEDIDYIDPNKSEIQICLKDIGCTDFYITRLEFLQLIKGMKITLEEFVENCDRI